MGINVERLKDFRDFIASRPPEKFRMDRWQTTPEERDDAYAFDVGALMSSCGSAACGGGWLAVMPAFQEAGGFVGSGGGPVLDGDSEASAFSKYFNIPYSLADRITTESDFYGKEDLVDVTREDFLAAIDEIIERAPEINALMRVTKNAHDDRIVECIL